ncbi:MAG: putative tagatose 1,6-diphosphate aldolase [Actinomycetota bacterium]
MSLDALRDEHGTFRVLAVDHRDSLRRFLAPDDPESVTRTDIVELKRSLVRSVSPFATGVMLEPEYSIPDLVADVAPGTGFFAALEAQGYLDDPSTAVTSVMPGWSVAAAVASGASCAKLLLPFHPDRPTAHAQVAVGTEVVAECRRAGIPVVLEPLFFGLDDPADRFRVVLATAQRFAVLGADLLKLPFPVDPAVVTDRGARVEACRAITVVCEQPWAILSGGGTFESFAEQVSDALAGGASGFMVGRALWGEAARARGDERQRIIDQVVLPRWRTLVDLTQPR